ncbi:MAG: hypothetical protein ACE5G8_09935, partial [Anaerolineae bacterium]
GGAIWRFDGQNWQVADSPTRSWLRAVTALSPGNAWAAGSEGTVLHYTGGQWEPVSAPTTARLFDVWFNSPTDGWAAGGDGVVLRYNGREWYAAPLPATPRETLGSITPPGGTGSLAPAPQPAADLRALAFTPAGQGVAVGSGGQVVCFQPAQTGSGNINCGGGAVVQTAELARHFYLPLMGKNSWSRQPIDLFGVQTVGGTFSRDPAIVFQMAEAGVRWARMPFSWKLIEPANTTPDRYRWSYHDDWFELLVAAGIRPMPFVARNPSWAGTFAAREIDRADEAEQEEFVGAAVSRYGRPPFNVTHWELYNEPDNADPHLSEVGWATWGNNPAGYADQLARLYPVIKAANPSSRVLLGGLGHTFFADTGGFFVRGFITDVVRAGGGNYFDILNFHYYGPDFSGQIDYFDDFLARFGLDKPLVCTEISHLEGSPVVEGQGELHARYLPQAMARGIAGSLPIVDWFAVADMEGMWRSGLFALDRTPRPAYTAYRVLTTVLGPARYARPLSPAEISGLPLEGYVFDTPGSGRLDVVWATQDTVVSWPVRAGWVTLTNKYGGARTVLDASDGRTDGRTTVRVGVNPLYVQYGSR